MFELRYYGGKEKLLNFIEIELSRLDLPTRPHLCDLFSGTAVVGRHFKKLGFNITSNDYLEFARCLASTRVGINEFPKFRKLKFDPINFLNRLPGEAGFFSNSYSPDGPDGRMYFTAENARRIDAARTQIQIWDEDGLISKTEKDFLICSILEAMNRTSNVSGTYAAFLKKWDSRALKPISFDEPLFTPGTGQHKIFSFDASTLASKISCDILYLDPPYNSRQYSSNYFLLDVVANGWFTDEPAVLGITGMRDNSNLKSDFCSKKSAASTLETIIQQADAKYLALSYSNEGIIQTSEILEMMAHAGETQVAEFTHRRYRAINHNPSEISTTEYLFILKKRQS